MNFNEESKWWTCFISLFWKDVSTNIYLQHSVILGNVHEMQTLSVFCQIFKKLLSLQVWTDISEWDLLTLPCSTREKNLSASLLKAVIFISPCWPAHFHVTAFRCMDKTKNCNVWHMLTCKRQIFRPLYSSTHTLIHYLKGEELALSSRITPCADIGLVCDSGSDSPPRDINRIDT